MTRGDRFLGTQMALALPVRKPRGRRARPAAGAAGVKAKGFTHLLCPRCGRYLVGALAGASALCPRCGVWADG